MDTPGKDRGFLFDDLGARRIALEPWSPLSREGIDAAAELIGEPPQGLTAIIAQRYVDIGAGLAYTARIKVRIVGDDSLPNPDSWALTDWKTTVTSEAPG